jgi:hypothetical protein
MKKIKPDHIETALLIGIVATGFAIAIKQLLFPA